MIMLKAKILLLILLAIAALGLIWRNGAFDKYLRTSEDSQIRQRMAMQWAQQAVRVITRSDGELANRPVVAVSAVVDDYQGTLCLELEKWLDRRNVKLPQKSWFQSACYAIGWHAKPKSIEAAIGDYQFPSASYILAAEIDNWTTFPASEQQLSGTLHLYATNPKEHIGSISITIDPTDLANGQKSDFASGTRFFQQNLVDSKPKLNKRIITASAGKEIISGLDRRFDDEQNSLNNLNFSSESHDRHASGKVWFHKGLGIWVVLVITGPWILRQPIASVLRRSSNQDNARMMVYWSLICLLTAMCLWAFWLPILSATVYMVGSLAFACIYLGFCCQWIEVI